MNAFLKKGIDYKSLYLRHFKNLPNVYFWSTFIVLFIGAIVGGIIILANAYWDEQYAMGIITIIFGPVIAWLLARLTRFIVAVSLSQKIVVADSLLTLSGNEIQACAEETVPKATNFEVKKEIVKKEINPKNRKFCLIWAILGVIYGVFPIVTLAPYSLTMVCWGIALVVVVVGLISFFKGKMFRKWYICGGALILGVEFLQFILNLVGFNWYMVTFVIRFVYACIVFAYMIFVLRKTKNQENIDVVEEEKEG